MHKESLSRRFPKDVYAHKTATLDNHYWCKASVKLILILDEKGIECFMRDNFFFCIKWKWWAFNSKQQRHSYFDVY